MTNDDKTGGAPAGGIASDPAYTAGLEFSRRGEFPGAIAAFEAAIARFPERPGGAVPARAGLPAAGRDHPAPGPAREGRGDRRRRPRRFGAGPGRPGRLEGAGEHRLDRAVPRGLPVVGRAVRAGHRPQPGRPALPPRPGPVPAVSGADRGRRRVRPGGLGPRARRGVLPRAGAVARPGGPARVARGQGRGSHGRHLGRRGPARPDQARIEADAASYWRTRACRATWASSRRRACSCTARRARARRPSPASWPTSRTARSWRLLPPRSTPCGWGRARRRSRSCSTRRGRRPRRSSFWTR